MKEEYVLCSVDNDWFGFFDNPCCIDIEGPGGLLLMANDLGSAKKRLFDDVFEMLEMALFWKCLISRVQKSSASNRYFLMPGNAIFLKGCLFLNS